MPAPFRKRPRPLADLVAAAIDPVLARQGFSEADLVLHWDDIVGERLASNSRPIKLQWPPRPAGQPDGVPRPATLVVRVEGAFAIELQHGVEQVLARINAHLGWRCVGRLAFRQGPVERPAPASRRKMPSAEAIAAAASAVTGIADDGLREALARLGAHVGTHVGTHAGTNVADR